MESSRPVKRRRVSGLITPLSLSPNGESMLDPGSNRSSHSSSNDDDNDGNAGSAGNASVLDRAIDVLRVEAEALAHIRRIYQTHCGARDGLTRAVGAVLASQRQRGKLVVCGVGKSAYIGMKLTATLKSLGVSASFLHACEALHGDVGDVRDRDTLLFVSYSGKTPELLAVLPHIPPAVHIMAISAHVHADDCQLLWNRDYAILLPAPIHETEETSLGVKAPTTSTIVALAVADMLALTIADKLHRGRTKEVFAKNHPGGAIGMSHREVEKLQNSEIDAPTVELPMSPSMSGED